MYRLVVCDLDGTLLNPAHRLGDYSQWVLAGLRARGVAVMLASGRHFEDIRAFSDQLSAQGCLISSNGAAVHDRQGRALFTHTLDPECVRELIADPAFADVHINLYRVDDWLVARPEPHLLSYHQVSGFAYRVADLGALDGTDVLKVFFYGDRDRLIEMEPAILARHGERVSTTFSLPVTLEVMAKGVSKGAALARVTGQLGIDLAEVIAFGDGMNDLEMLGGVGQGILMDNADPRLREALPGLPVIGSHADESVARYLERLFLSD